MSIATHINVGTNGSSGSRPVGTSAKSATRPRDLLRLPAFAAPQPDSTDDPVDPPDELPRASGARCRMGMGYLD